MKDDLTTFYIVRHGETEWNAVGRIQGHTDSALSSIGEKQAKNLAIELKDIHFDLAFSSDLIRAHRTAEIIVAERNLTVATTEVLRERLYGQFEGEKRESMYKFYETLTNLLQEEQEKHREQHGVETDVSLISRLLTFLRETAVSYEGKTVLVVSHGGMMRALLVHLGEFGPDPGRKIRVENTGYIKLQSDGTDFFVQDMKGIINLD